MLTIPTREEREMRAVTDKGFTKFIVALICFGSLLLAILNWSESDIDDSTTHNVINHPINSSEIYHCNQVIKQQTNRNNLSMDDIEKLKKLRLKQVTMCSSPNGNLSSFNKYSDLLSKLPPNLVSYSNKCEIRAIHGDYKEFGGVITVDPLKINKSDPNHLPLLGFIHIFKNGDNSIRDTMRRIIPGLSKLKWRIYKKQTRALLTDLFIFSFIRNPIHRVLSGQTDINSLKSMLKSIKNRMECTLNVHDNNMSVQDIYLNIDLYPQMLYLMNYPLNYIGESKDIFNTTFEILYEIYIKKNKQITKEEFFNTYNSLYIKGKDTDNIDAKLEYKDLSDVDIMTICEIYWMDYLCLPFHIPKQCNLTQLFIKHYGHNIVYRDCWDTDFVYKLVHDHINYKRGFPRISMRKRNRKKQPK